MMREDGKTDSQFKTDVQKVKDTTGSVVVALQLCQEVYGHITPKAIETISDVFNQSRCAVYSVATFYHQFTFTPKGKNVVAVCMGTACFVLGAADLLKAIEDELGIKAGGVTLDGLFSVEHNTRCVGRCDIAPIVVINDNMIGNATVKGTINQLKQIKKDAGGA